MPNTVVITRPLAQCQAMARSVAASGRQVALLPLLVIEPLADPTPLSAALAELESYALVAFVSPNAIDAAFGHIGQWPAGVALAVLGQGSRSALAQHGVTDASATIFSPLDPAHSDSEHLLQALDLDALRGRRVLIVRGESGRELIADGLRAAGALVSTVAAYRRSVPRLTAELRATLTALLAHENDWIVTSSEALRGLMQLVRELDARGVDATAGEAAGEAAVESAVESAVVKMQHQHLLVPHARIAQTAEALGFTRLTLTGSGDERLLAALHALQSRP